MNERIKELAKQAFDTAEYPADQQYRIEPNSEFCKKFAELIVQECYSICEDIGDKGLDGHYCADEIKRTFVVK